VVTASSAPLESLRLAAGLSRPKVAKALGLSERHIYRFERGTTPLKRPYAKALADLYDVNLETVEAAARTAA
jgi:transcriptional regulator with XRE-family HTH domain